MQSMVTAHYDASIAYMGGEECVSSFEVAMRNLRVRFPAAVSEDALACEKVTGCVCVRALNARRHLPADGGYCAGCAKRRPNTPASFSSLSAFLRNTADVLLLPRYGGMLVTLRDATVEITDSITTAADTTEQAHGVQSSAPSSHAAASGSFCFSSHSGAPSARFAPSATPPPHHRGSMPTPLARSDVVLSTAQLLVKLDYPLLVGGGLDHGTPEQTTAVVPLVRMTMRITPWQLSVMANIWVYNFGPYPIYVNQLAELPEEHTVLALKIRFPYLCFRFVLPELLVPAMELNLHRFEIEMQWKQDFSAACKLTLQGVSMHGCSEHGGLPLLCAATRDTRPSTEDETPLPSALLSGGDGDSMGEAIPQGCLEPQGTGPGAGPVAGIQDCCDTSARIALSECASRPLSCGADDVREQSTTDIGRRASCWHRGASRRDRRSAEREQQRGSISSSVLESASSPASPLTDSTAAGELRSNTLSARGTSILPPLQVASARTSMAVAGRSNTSPFSFCGEERPRAASEVCGQAGSSQASLLDPPSANASGGNATLTINSGGSACGGSLFRRLSCSSSRDRSSQVSRASVKTPAGQSAMNTGANDTPTAAEAGSACGCSLREVCGPAGAHGDKRAHADAVHEYDREDSASTRYLDLVTSPDLVPASLSPIVGTAQHTESGKPGSIDREHDVTEPTKMAMWTQLSFGAPPPFGETIQTYSTRLESVQLLVAPGSMLRLAEYISFLRSYSRMGTNPVSPFFSRLERFATTLRIRFHAPAAIHEKPFALSCAHVHADSVSLHALARRHGPFIKLAIII